MEELKPIRVAQVGAYKRFSDEDSCRNVTALAAIMQLDPSFKGEPQHDVINLLYGRDFLTEKEAYDLVILHSIFLKPNKWEKILAEKGLPNIKNPQLNLSPVDSLKRWRKKLASTNAEFIVVCEGQPNALSGWQLGQIEGYEILRMDTLVTVYRKVKHA